MTSPAELLLQEIIARRKALQSNYTEYDLHQLRVSVRRLRSLLRFDDKPEAWQLRREWSYLIGSSNPARDWDTLADTMALKPDTEIPVALHSAVEVARTRMRDRALASLQVSQWADSIEQTAAYIERAKQLDGDGMNLESMTDEASARLAQAWGRVQQHKDNRSWHKLRIAIKDLRYCLDTPAGSGTDKRIGWCKLLQDELGTWHDTVVHRGLLDRLHDELNFTDNDPASKAITSLKHQLEERATSCLEKVDQIMEAKGSLLGLGSAQGPS